MMTWIESSRVSRREKRDRKHIELRPQTPVSTLSQDDLPLVVVSHNEINILSSFLEHYRKLGVTRFIFVDDVSTDGTREFLASHPDVDLWTSPIRFAEARRGRQWREQLFDTYGKNRWYLNLDSDEFLFFADSETRSIQNLIAILEAEGDKRLAAPMLDMYRTFLGEEKSSNTLPWQFSDHFDRQGYDMSVGKRGISIKGGPRGRKFNEQNELVKYPLIYWDDECLFGSSIHRPLPYGRNFPKNWGALLHLKFFVNYKEKISEAVDDKQHYGGSSHYVKLLEEIQKSGSLNFYDEHISVKFTGSKQLVDLGFITPINWK
ncbi:hypothetical protein A6R70_02945 [Agrobacterium rubi]|uniref:glycosyltransferase family 2 protein n=1 Tax=Agrobacterium rubi TaxID=28099 RepID=UPI0005EAD2B6|nr:glycosyltransferase family 2 protein [Agrobacterium rubi]MCL6651241.1 hypothetical protein [Agrobacterium rubi]